MFFAVHPSAQLLLAVHIQVVFDESLTTLKFRILVLLALPAGAHNAEEFSPPRARKTVVVDAGGAPVLALPPRNNAQAPAAVSKMRTLLEEGQHEVAEMNDIILLFGQYCSFSIPSATFILFRIEEL